MVENSSRLLEAGCLFKGSCQRCVSWACPSSFLLSCQWELSLHFSSSTERRKENVGRQRASGRPVLAMWVWALRPWEQLLLGKGRIIPLSAGRVAEGWLQPGRGKPAQPRLWLKMPRSRRVNHLATAAAGRFHSCSFGKGALFSSQSYHLRMRAAHF